VNERQILSFSLGLSLGSLDLYYILCPKSFVALVNKDTCLACRVTLYQVITTSVDPLDEVDRQHLVLRCHEIPFG
jgi:hypothetical protein